MLFPSFVSSPFLFYCSTYSSPIPMDLKGFLAPWRKVSCKKMSLGWPEAAKVANAKMMAISNKIFFMDNNSN